MNKVSTVIFLLILLGCQSSHKNTIDPFAQFIRFVDQYSESILEQGNISTMSVAIYKSGKTYHNYYGVIDSGAENLPNDNTLFEIASISKIFTGSLMAIAVIEKKVSLDTDIRKFLPKVYPDLEY